MEKKESSIEITKVFQKVPEMLVIKGRQKNSVSLPAQPLSSELRKFAKIKNTLTLPIRLPLDSIAPRFIKRFVDVFLSTIIIV